MVKFVPYFNTCMVVKNLDKEICDNQSRRAKSQKHLEMLGISSESVALHTMSEQGYRVCRPSIPIRSVSMPVSEQNDRDHRLDVLMKDLIEINEKLSNSRESREEPRKEEEPVEKNNDSVEEEEEEPVEKNNDSVKEEEEKTKKEEKQNFFMRLIRPHDK